MKSDESYILNEAFQYVDDKFLDIAEQEKKTGKRRQLWLYLCTAVVCICIFFVLPIVVIAGRWFGLKDPTVQEINTETESTNDTIITLPGHIESPEGKAWEDC